MIKLPKIAIVGRPNVGKSALFNRIAGKRIAIVDEAEGITRDRLYAEAECFGRRFEVIDTAGIDKQSHAEFNEEVIQQAEIAIEEADALIMVVDSQVGPTALDMDVAKILLRTKKPICLAVNKVDSFAQQHTTYEFLCLGIQRQVPISASHNWQIAELLEAILKDLPLPTEDQLLPGLKIAIVGRPNVGKSSLVNFLLKEDRCVVSPIPGTTRDNVNVSFTYGEDLYTLIDTAGIRRKKAEHETVEKFAAIRTKEAIDRCDVCLLILDAQQGMTVQEKKIASMIEEAGKGCIILFNKWDLVKGFRMEHCLQDIEEKMPFLQHCPKIFISAITGRNVTKIFPVLQQVAKAATQRITTHQLNNLIEKSLQQYHPPMLQGRRLRIYYTTQVEIQPPSFLLFVNNPTLMVETYRKYLLNKLRETYPFIGNPVRMFMRKKGAREPQ